MNEPKTYPAWRYHRYEAPVLVQTAEESAVLGPEWADTPAAFCHVPAVHMDHPEPEPEPSVVVLPTPRKPRK